MSKQILLIDDSKNARELVSMTLTPEGYQVIEAVDGNDGLSQAKKNSFHLIIIDYTMPNMDGLSLLKILRALPKYTKEVPILFLTIQSGDEFKAQAKEFGATGVLVKPFNPKKLIEVIKKLIG